MANLLKPQDSHCPNCGVPNTEGATESLYDIYYRIRDGRSSYEALTFDSAWLQENVQDEDDERALDLAMSKDMVNRGLCPTCGRPDLRGVKPEDIMDEDEAEALWDMWAEQAAERRMGA